MTSQPLKLVLAVACVLGSPTAGADSFDDLEALLGGKNGKLVVRDQNDGNKLYVFDTTSRTFYKLSEEIECLQPLLSPDGTRVVYEHGGTVCIRPLDGGDPATLVAGYDGHWWVDPQGDEWIYYTTVGDNPEETSRKVWYPSNGRGIQTRRIRLKDQLDEFVFDWKCSAGVSRDGTHLGAAYSTMVIFEVPTGIAYVVNGGSQGCNGSMSPDNRYYLMQLVLPHTVFSFRDRYDNVIWEIQNPFGTQEWQTPEFSTHLDYASATAKEDTGFYSAWVVKISTLETLRVLDTSGGSNWSEPHLWVEDSPQVDCIDGESRACGRDEGACQSGAQECLAGFWSDCAGEIPPSDEICDDLLDNDCDGLTDTEDTEDCGGGEEAGPNPDADAGADGWETPEAGTDEYDGGSGDESAPADAGGDQPPDGCSCGGHRPIANAMVFLVALALLRRRK